MLLVPVDAMLNVYGLLVASCELAFFSCAITVAYIESALIEFSFFSHIGGLLPVVACTGRTVHVFSTVIAVEVLRLNRTFTNKSYFCGTKIALLPTSRTFAGPKIRTFAHPRVMTSSKVLDGRNRTYDVMGAQNRTFATNRSFAAKKSHFCGEVALLRNRTFGPPTGGHIIGCKYPEIPPLFLLLIFKNCHSFSRFPFGPYLAATGHR